MYLLTVWNNENLIYGESFANKEEAENLKAAILSDGVDGITVKVYKSGGKEL